MTERTETRDGVAREKRAFGTEVERRVRQRARIEQHKFEQDVEREVNRRINNRRGNDGHGERAGPWQPYGQNRVPRGLDNHHLGDTRSPLGKPCKHGGLYYEMEAGGGRGKFS